MIARRVGPGLVLGAVLVGIVAGEHAGPSPAGGLLVGALVAGAGAVVAAPRYGVPALAGVVVVAAGAGAALTARALDGQARSPLTGLVEGRADAVVDATLAADPDPTRFRTAVPARVHVVRRGGPARDGGDRTVVVDATGDAASRVGVLQAGDRVRLRGYFRPLNEFEDRWRWRHAVGAFAAHDVVGFAPPDDALLQVANRLRRLVLAGHRGVPEPQRALVAGFLLGDTVDLPERVVHQFRAAGLSHLVAVSGQNVAFVLALAGPLVHRGPRGARLVAGVTVLVVFAAMTRFEPSVLRASAMAATAMVALFAGRPTAGLRLLAIAITALLLADPFLVHSVGFRLSCAASAGIALFAVPIAARIPGPRAFGEMLGVTVGAQLAVAPLLVAEFGAVPLVAVPANLLVAPFAGPLTVLGLVGGVVGGLVPIGALTAVVTLPAYACASAVLVVAALASRVPLDVGPTGGAVTAALASLTFAWRRRRRATWPGARTRGPRSRLAVPPR